jgi:hypothetical protein
MDSSLFSVGEPEDPREGFGKFWRTFTIADTEVQRDFDIIKIILCSSPCLCASVVKSFTQTKQRRA